MTSVILLLSYVGLDVLGFNLLSLIPLGLVFFITVMQDKPLARREHQYFLLTLIGVTAWEFFTLSWLWAIVMVAFTLLYMSSYSKNMTQLKKVKAEAVNVGNVIKRKVFNFNVNKNE